MNEHAENVNCHEECTAHSGIKARLKSGGNCMARLEKAVEKLRDDFSDHVTSSSRSTIALLIGILMCFLTTLGGIYINSLHPKDKYSSQAEMTMLVKEITKAITAAKKPNYAELKKQ